MGVLGPSKHKHLIDNYVSEEEVDISEDTPPFFRLVYFLIDGIGLLPFLALLEEIVCLQTKQANGGCCITTNLGREIKTDTRCIATFHT